MSDEYTPDDEDVEVYFALGLCEYSVGNGGVSIDKAHDAYRAWLDAHDRELRERIAREIEGQAWTRVQIVEALRSGRDMEFCSGRDIGICVAARIARGEVGA